VIQKYLHPTMLQISCYELTERLAVIFSRKSSVRCSKGTITPSYFRRPTHRTQDYAVSHLKKKNVAAGPTPSTPPMNLHGNFPLTPVLQTRDITFLFPTTITAIPSQTIAGATFLYSPERRSMKRARGSLPR